MILPVRSIGALGALALLSGCISFGAAEPPPQLLTLTPASVSPAGSETIGTSDTAIIVDVPDSPQKINVTRIPVQVDASTIAYLKDGVWVEKPARLFRSLMAETIRTRTGRIVLDQPDLVGGVSTHLRGTLRDFGYDARNSSVVVRYDAIRELGNGVIESRRFEREIGGIEPEYTAVGAALNRAANEVAIEVAAWIA